MHINDALAELGAQLGLPDLSLNENRLARVVFDADLVVDMEASPDMNTLHLYATGASIPAKGSEQTLEAMLLQNMPGKLPGFAAHGVDRAASEAVLFRTIDMRHVDYPSFVQIVDGFVNAVDQVQTEGLQARESGTATPPRPADMPHV